MVKHEIKIQLNKVPEIREIIQKTYFEQGFGGKIMGQGQPLIITESDDINWSIFSGLHNTTIKVINEEIIDGTMRFVIEEGEGEIRLFPISTYCFLEDDRYTFY